MGCVRLSLRFLSRSARLLPRSPEALLRCTLWCTLPSTDAHLAYMYISVLPPFRL